jgi:hypothetical protein
MQHDLELRMVEAEYYSSCRRCAGHGKEMGFFGGEYSKQNMRHRLNRPDVISFPQHAFHESAVPEIWPFHRRSHDSQQG